MPPEEPPLIRIDPATAEESRLWSAALELADAFGTDREWCLVGGLMVQVHGIEHRDGLRPTVDVDFLADARSRPPMTERIAAILVERGAEVAMPPRSNPRLGYRFEMDGEVIEVLGPTASPPIPRPSVR